MDFKVVLSGATGFLGTTITYLFGGIDKAIIALVIFMSLDILSGMLNGAKKKELSSNNMYKGLKKKAMIFIIIIVANLLDMLIGGDSNIFRNATIFFYIVMEALSIFENAVSFGIPVPEKLVQYVNQMNNKNKE